MPYFLRLHDYKFHRYFCFFLRRFEEFHSIDCDDEKQKHCLKILFASQEQSLQYLTNIWINNVLVRLRKLELDMPSCHGPHAFCQHIMRICVALLASKAKRSEDCARMPSHRDFLAAYFNRIMCEE